MFRSILLMENKKCSANEFSCEICDSQNIKAQKSNQPLPDKENEILFRLKGSSFNPYQTNKKKPTFRLEGSSFTPNHTNKMKFSLLHLVKFHAGRKLIPLTHTTQSLIINSPSTPGHSGPSSGQGSGQWILYLQKHDKHFTLEGRKEMLYLTTHSTHLVTVIWRTEPLR